MWRASHEMPFDDCIAVKYKSEVCMMNYYTNDYGVREAVTKRNKQNYDHRQNKLLRECLKLEPDYYGKTIKERMAIRQRVLCGNN